MTQEEEVQELLDISLKSFLLEYEDDRNFIGEDEEQLPDIEWDSNTLNPNNYNEEDKPIICTMCGAYDGRHDEECLTNNI